MKSVISLLKSSNPNPVSLKITTWEVFNKKYLSREDGYKYEWLNGTIEKTKRTMDSTQVFITNNLIKFFNSLALAGKFEGLLSQETDIFFLKNHRRPDIVYLTENQIVKAAYGENQVPDFLIEIISNNDQMNLVHSKMQDYRAAGVKVVWHIFPRIKEIHIYSGGSLNQMLVCRGNDICSANPVLPAFEMTADAVFYLPPKP